MRSPLSLHAKVYTELNLEVKGYLSMGYLSMTPSDVLSNDF